MITKTVETEKSLLKKEFMTIWSESAVMVMDRLTLPQEQFFYEAEKGSKSRHALRYLVHPDSIPYREIRSFVGKRTKITIEVIE